VDNLESSFLGRFGRGAYWLRSNLDAAAHAVASQHEELHGIVRRSTAYGGLLRSLEALAATEDSPDLQLVIQALTSRARTSEEVFATYGSFRGAQGGPLTAAAARRLIEEYPAYGLYNEIGAELVGAEQCDALATVALDAIVRFCWSSRETPPLDDAVSTWSGLAAMPRHVYPDERLRMLRRAWSAAELEWLLAVVDADARRVLAIDLQPLMLAARLQPSLVAVDYDADRKASDLRAILAEGKDVLTMKAYLEEQLVATLLDRLCERFADTPLAALPFSEVLTFLHKRPVGLPLAPTAHPFPEILQLRADPLRVSVVAGGHRVLPVLFARSRESFQEQFAWDVPRQPPLPDCVWYRARADVDKDDSLELVVELDSDGASAPARLARDECVGAWASAYGRWPHTFDALHDGGAPLWLICDVSPTQLVRATRHLLRRPLLARADAGGAAGNCGALVVHWRAERRALGGIIVPGSKVVLDALVVPNLTRVLDRYYVDPESSWTPDGSSVSGGAHSALIVDWLFRTERTLSFTKRI
jgi:hypothetical protein